MQRITNRLHKVRNSSDTRGEHIPITMASLILSVVADEHIKLEGKTVEIFNCCTGILASGVSLLQPQSIVHISTDKPDRIVFDNIKEFKICCDIVQGGDGCFIDKAFNIAIVGPQFQKMKGVDFSRILLAVKTAKIVYALQKSEFFGQLKQVFSTAEVICSLDISLHHSSHHLKTENKLVSFVVVRIV
ncbi:hypothetical protein PAEPH01_0581 [Pancytospora epiphaga]|nr:hypothetical protein PAEPH01_0581 [Pancytospora epiphaga]